MKGSELWLFSDVPMAERHERLAAGGLDVETGLVNLTLKHHEGDAVNRKDLERLPLETFDSVLILANTKEGLKINITDIDSRSLATLLLIRDIQAKRTLHGTPASADSKPPMAALSRESTQSVPSHASGWVHDMAHVLDQTVVISEILDPRTRNLIADTGVSDYVLSNEIVSMALAMVSENYHVNGILAELFTEVGNELYIRPADRYVHPGEELSFYDLMARVRLRAEILMGYKTESMARALINPEDKATKRVWGRFDVLVIMAEDDL